VLYGRELWNAVKAAGDKTWYKIQNKTDTMTEVFIYDEIGFWGVTASDFVAAIEKVDTPEMNIRINSPGGDVFDGLAIYNSIKRHKSKVVTYVDGIAASAASFIAQAGDVRVMMPHSQLMIHDAMTFGWGNAGELREIADNLDRQSNNIAGIYAGKGNKSIDDYRTLMLAESWFFAQEAVDAGLADRVEEDIDEDEDADETVELEEAANSWNTSVFDLKEKILNRIANTAAPVEEEVVIESDEGDPAPEVEQVPKGEEDVFEEEEEFAFDPDLIKDSLAQALGQFVPEGANDLMKDIFDEMARNAPAVPVLKHEDEEVEPPPVLDEEPEEEVEVDPVADKDFIHAILEATFNSAPAVAEPEPSPTPEDESYIIDMSGFKDILRQVARETNYNKEVLL